MFEKGKAYQFRIRRVGRGSGTKVAFHNTGIKAVTYEYLSQEKGCGMTLHLFQSVGGKWRESFTPEQIGDYEVREAGK
jgi:hypothetical protein